MARRSASSTHRAEISDLGTEPPDLPGRTVVMTIIAQDPAVREASRIVTAQVKVPEEHLAAGPQGARFHVVDYDAATGELVEPYVMVDSHGNYVDRYADASNDVLVNDPGFRAQNVFAIASRTLARFEFALGRRLGWGFSSHQLFLVPHGLAEANAYYADDQQAVLLGYFPASRRHVVQTCLSHDIVAHETTHAILDGLRHRYLEPSLPDQPAFHEALADIVAILSVFSMRPVVERLLGPADRRGRIRSSSVARDQLEKNSLLVIGEEFGRALSGERTGGLRQLADVTVRGDAWQSDAAFEEEHDRGLILVAIVLRAFLRLWVERLERLGDLRLDRGLAAEEGATAADHLLTMIIRAIDYLPPVDFEFQDLLGAIVMSDREVMPDDEHHYRDALVASFADFGIHPPPAARFADLRSTGGLGYDVFNYEALKSAPAEVNRYLWANAESLGIDRRYYTVVESVQPAVRVGIDGLVVNETAAYYIQMLELTGREFRDEVNRWRRRTKSELRLTERIDADVPVQVFGGGTLIFDQFGRLKYHIHKPLGDWGRQARRMDFLVRYGRSDQAGRFGFSLGMPAGQTFAALHQPGAIAGESW
jgi:hypothetical protein